MSLSGSDITKGREVKWYAGGVYTRKTATGSSPAITSKAQFGSVVVTVNGVDKKVTETGSLAAGTTSYSITAPDSGDEVVLEYIEIGTTAMTHVASSAGAKRSASVDIKSESIDGQAIKIQDVGASALTAELNEFYYTPNFIAACMGTLHADSPQTGMSAWSSAGGMNKIGGLVGIRKNAAGTATQLYIIIGGQCTNIDLDHPSDTFYKKLAKFACDHFKDIDLNAS